MREMKWQMNKVCWDVELLRYLCRTARSLTHSLTDQLVELWSCHSTSHSPTVMQPPHLPYMWNTDFVPSSPIATLRFPPPPPPSREPRALLYTYDMSNNLGGSSTFLVLPSLQTTVLVLGPVSTSTISTWTKRAGWGISSRGGTEVTSSFKPLSLYPWYTLCKRPCGSQNWSSYDG
jgi:hypothetical protein